MDFLGNMSIKEVGEALTTEGIGTAGGILGGGFLGAKVEDYFVVPGSITSVSTLTDKLKGWAANNVPKMGLWYLMRKYDATTPLTADIKKGIMGSIVLDTIVRAAGSGVPAPVNINFGGTNIRILGANPGNTGGSTQALAQENAVLRAELNKAMRQLTSGSSGIRVQEVQAPAPPPYPLASTAPARDEKFGFMQGPTIARREKEYGFAGESIQSTDKIAKMFGML